MAKNGKSKRRGKRRHKEGLRNSLNDDRARRAAQRKDAKRKARAMKGRVAGPR